jgi:predicted nucleic acid-binding protein
MSDPDGTRAFVDTNIWLYAFIETQDASRHECAETVIRNCTPVLSTQVINEVCVNLLRRAAFTEDDLSQLIEAFYDDYYVVVPSRQVLIDASRLRRRYSLSFWDSMIVASAMSAKVSVLYSEDMQDGLVINGQLKIVNPLAN